MAPKDRQIQILETKQDFSANIPPEIMIDILSRLRLIPTVLRCKRVCRSWLSLVESFEFAKSHFSKSVAVPCLALDEGPITVALFRDKRIPRQYEILELVDSEESGQQCNVVFEFNFPHPKLHVHSSADGLLFMFDKFKKGPFDLFICNPITREYMKLPPLSLPPPPAQVSSIYEVFGFGVSKLTGKYKVVRLFKDSYVDSSSWPRKCEVYTLGTGSWRSVAHGGPFRYSFTSSNVFLNGNLHWLVRVLMQGDSLKRISYFDLETECFSTFSIPGHRYGLRSLCALGHSLCLCHNVSRDHVIDIWLMNKYGDDNSWRKEFVIKKHVDRCPKSLGDIVPIMMFKNGDVLFANCPKLFRYSSKTETIREVDVTEPFSDLRLELSTYTPSFLPLKSFAMEKVSTF